jgi:hypothetical protein
MKLRTKWTSTGAAAALVALVLVPLSTRAGATTPAFEPDPNSEGTVAFYNSAGVHITSGNNLSHLFDYAVASSAGRAGTTKATVFFGFPDHTKPDSSTWFSSQASSSTVFPNTGAPAPINGFTTPVATVSPSGANLAAQLSTATLDTTPGYVNIIQVRVKDSGPGIPALVAPFWETDILFNQAANTWTQVFPATLDVTTSSPLPNGLVDKAYPTTKLAATGGTGTLVWSLAGGALPTGVKLATTGTLTGTPTAAGTFSFTVSVHDAATPTPLAGTKTLSLTINPMVITTTSLPVGVIDKAYAAKLAESGGKGTFIYTVIAGSLPAGIKLSTAGAFSGVPTVAGTTSFTVQLKDHNTPTPNVATADLSITINPMTITTTSLPNGVHAKAYSAKLAVSGGKSPWVWSEIAGSLPPGVKLSSAGAFSGTPTSAGAFSFTVQVKDGTKPTALVATATLSITIT